MDGEIAYEGESRLPAAGFLRPLSAREATVGQQTGIVSAEAQIERVASPDGEWREAREADVGFEDKVEADGKTYNVAGRFFRRSATGRLDYLHLDLSAVE